MKSVLSKDGTRIAFDSYGSGTPVILVAGAFSFRKFKTLLELSELLAPRFTVINYDRRGRGDSGDKAPYAVEREIEDLAALIQEIGGEAHVWGLSSGATLVLRAAVRRLPITKMALYEPPFLIDRDGHLPPVDFELRLKEMIAANQRNRAIRYFLVDGMGAPFLVPYLLRCMPGPWKDLSAVAHTLPYDAAVLGDTICGKPPVAHAWTSPIPALVMSGSKSPAALQKGARAIAQVLPNARHISLQGQNHNVSMKALAPVLAEFLAA